VLSKPFRPIGSLFLSATALLVASPARADEVIVYQNGFESADTCAWAATVPAATCDPEMVFVPAGDFKMGSDWNPTDFPNELPIHTVTLSAYWIDRNDVTMDEYAACVTASGCPVPVYSYLDNSECNWGSPRGGSNPINCVDWQQGETYCTWAGKRYPTEAEWEKAARGENQPEPTYPWGEAAPTCNYAVMDDPKTGFEGCGLNATGPVGSKPAGSSPYGALDMAGDVWDWVNDWFSPTYYSVSPATDPPGPATGTSRVLRGGSWSSTGGADLRSSMRISNAPNQASYGFGFRCAKND